MFFYVHIYCSGEHESNGLATLLTNMSMSDNPVVIWSDSNNQQITSRTPAPWGFLRHGWLENPSKNDQTWDKHRRFHWGSQPILARKKALDPWISMAILDHRDRLYMIIRCGLFFDGRIIWVVIWLCLKMGYSHHGNENRGKDFSSWILQGPWS